jgi:hypothetical protein
MATKKQIAANRRNAKKCTGPKTPEGKAASSMNALRHGLRARTVVLPDESQEDYDQLHAGFQEKYRPQDPVEQHLVDLAAIAQWKLARADALDAQCDAKAKTPEARAANLGRMSQIDCRLQRAYFKAYKELERIKTAREKQAEQSKQPGQSKQPDQPKAPDQPPSKVNLVWLDRVTGKRDLLCKLENGKAVEHFSHESPTPTPNNDE